MDARKVDWRKNPIYQPPHRGSSVPYILPPPSTAPVDINPGAGGAFTSVAGAANGDIYATSDLAGTYKSINKGASWTVLGQTPLGVRPHHASVACHPTNSQILWVATDRKISKSIDGGASFTDSNVTTGYTTCLAVAKSNPSIVYAARHSSTTALDCSIWKSTDGGATFADMGVPAASLRIIKLIVHPADPNTLLALEGDDIFVAVTTGRLYLSTNGATSWAETGASLIADAGDLFFDCAFHPTDNQTFYATIREDDPGHIGDTNFWIGELCHTTNAGAAWSRTTPSTPHTGAIYVNPVSTNILRVMDIQRFPSANAADRSGIWEFNRNNSTWTKTMLATNYSGGWQGTAAADIQAAHGKNIYGYGKSIGQSFGNSEAFLLVNSQFIHLSESSTSMVNVFTNGSVGSWRGRRINNVTLAALDIAEDGRVYLGYHDLGLWRSDDEGEHGRAINDGAFSGEWTNGKYGGNCISVLVDPADSSKIWAALGSPAATVNVRRSTNGGTTWANTTGISDSFVRGLSLARASTPGSRVLLVSAGGDIYKSTNDGVNWSVVLTQATAGGAMYTTAIDPVDSNLMYAGGIGGLWRSTNGGTNWSNISATDMNGTANGAAESEIWNGTHHVSTHKSVANQVHVAAYGGSGLRGLWVSTNTGTNWTKVRTGDRWRYIIADPFVPTSLYACSSEPFKGAGDHTKSEGIMVSTNFGSTWAALPNTDFPYPGVVRVAFNPGQRSKLYLGVHGAGFFRKSL